MKTPMLNNMLRTEIIDGRVYVDLEQLVQFIFDVSNESMVTATRTWDPALGAMTLGVSHVGKALEGVLTVQKEAAGLTDQGSPCGLSVPHAEHGWLKARKTQRCPGLPSV